MSAPMTRCECHEIPFSKVVRHAQRHPGQDFKTLCAQTGCGQTCTACHCDLKAYLRENARPIERPRTPTVHTPALATSPAL